MGLGVSGFVGYAVRTCGGSVICSPDSLGDHCRGERWGPKCIGACFVQAAQ